MTTKRTVTTPSRFLATPSPAYLTAVRTLVALDHAYLRERSALKPDAVS
jgi:hypothetical protein